MTINFDEIQDDEVVEIIKDGYKMETRKTHSSRAYGFEGYNCKIVFETVVPRAAEQKLIEKDIVINFLRKELYKKTYCRQVMKRQYREMKQKCNSLQRYKDFVKWSGKEEDFKSFLRIKGENERV